MIQHHADAMRAWANAFEAAHAISEEAKRYEPEGARTFRITETLLQQLIADLRRWAVLAEEEGRDAE